MYIFPQDADRERAVYKDDVDRARKEVEGMVVPAGPVPPMSTDLARVHYTFDYSKNVVIPHHAMQMGPLYFVSGRKVQIFGVRHDAVDAQYNYLINEEESIGNSFNSYSLFVLRVICNLCEKVRVYSAKNKAKVDVIFCMY